MTIDPTLSKVYAVTTPEECVEAYRDWAKGYEDDVVGRFGYVAPKVTAEAFAQHLAPGSAPVLDAGCGTGLVGTELAARGFATVDGLDICPEMLEEARAKAVYRDLMEADLTRPLTALDGDTYAGVISVGTFTHGHVGTEGLDELLRVTRPGGIVCLTINEGVYDDYGFEDAFAALEEQDVARVLENRPEDYLSRQGIGCRLATLQVA